MTNSNANAFVKSGKTSSSLLKKILQDDLRDRLKLSLDKVSKGDYSMPPLAVLVDLTTKCNLGCSWCIDKYVLSTIELSEKRALKLLDEFSDMGVKSIVYFGGGEPLMHPAIEKVLKKTKELNIDYAINTNGILLDKAKETIAKTCSWLRISLDVGSREKYKQIHESKDLYNKIIENIKNINKIKKGTVGISYIIMEENIDEIFIAAQKAKKNGCDFIQFKPKYIPLKTNKRLLNYYIKKLNPIIKSALKKARKLEDDSFIVLITDSLNTLLDGKIIHQNKTYSYCAAQQFIPLITPTGVYVCPNWRGSENKSFGNIQNSSFRKIWEGRQRRCVINKTDPSKECSLACLRHQTNVLLNAVITANKMGFNLLDKIVQSEGSKISDRYFI